MKNIQHVTLIKLLTIIICSFFTINIMAQSQKDREQQQREASQRVSEAQNRYLAEKQRLYNEGLERVRIEKAEQASQRERDSEKMTENSNRLRAEANQHIKNGDAFYNKGAYGDAIREYISGSYNTSADKDDVNYIIGKSYLNLQDYNNAIKYFKQASFYAPEKAEKRANVQIDLGFANIQNGNNDKAIEVLEELVKFHPTKFLGWQNLSVAYRNVSRYDDAKRAAREMVALQPDNFWGYWYMAKAYEESGLPNEAINHYQKAVSLEKSEESFSLTSLYNIYIKQKSYALANAAAAAYLKRFPTSQGAINIFTTTQHFIDGDKLFQQKKYAEAAEAYWKGIAYTTADEVLYDIYMSYMNLQWHGNAFIPLINLILNGNLKAEELWNNLTNILTRQSHPSIAGTSWGVDQQTYNFFSDGTLLWNMPGNNNLYGRWKQTGGMLEIDIIQDMDNKSHYLVSSAIFGDSVISGAYMSKNLSPQSGNFLIRKKGVITDDKNDRNKTLPPMQSVANLFESNAAKPFCDYVSKGNIEQVKVLLENKPHVINTNNCCENMPILHCLVQNNGSSEMLKFLLSKGINVNVTESKSAYTALHLATQKNNKILMEVLLKAGANPNQKDKWAVALHYAREHPELVKLLIDHGADVRIKDHLGQTALDELKRIKYKSPEVQRSMELLKSKRQASDLNRVNTNAITIQKKVTEKDTTYIKTNADVAEMSKMKFSATDIEDFFTVIRLNKEKEIKDFLLKGIEVNWQDSFGRTPLYIAVGFGHKEATALLLAAGANPNIKTKNHIIYAPTILHLSLDVPNPEIIAMLLNNGADANIKGYDGKTPLDLALTLVKKEKYNTPQMHEAIQLLKSKRTTR